jgi:hypothetical protein
MGQADGKKVEHCLPKVQDTLGQVHSKHRRQKFEGVPEWPDQNRQRMPEKPTDGAPEMLKATSKRLPEELIGILRDLNVC